MQRVDIVIAVIAAVALAGSLLGLSLYDEPEYRRFDVNVIEEEGSLDQDAGLTLSGPGGGDNGELMFEHPNITSITFTITADLTNPDDVPLRNSDTVIEVEFTPPDGNISTSPVRFSIPAEETEASEPYTIQIQEAPSGQSRVLAQNASGAMIGEDGALIIPITTNGTGSWDIQAAIASGGGTTNPVTGDPIQSEEIRVTITAEYTFYRAHATLNVPGDSSVI